MSGQTFTLRPSYPKGQCKLCAGEGLGVVAAWDGRATKCVRHLTEKERLRHGLTLPVGEQAARAQTPEFTVIRPDGGDGKTPPPNPTPPPDSTAPKTVDQRNAEINKLATDLLGFNAQIVKAFAWSCEPMPASEIYTVNAQTGVMTITPNGQAVMVKPADAQRLARAIVDVQDIPQFKAVNKVLDSAVKPYLPFVSVLTAAAVIGWHGFQMVKLRDDLRHSWATIEAQNRSNSSFVADSPVDPRPSDESAADDEPAAVDDEGEPVVIRDMGDLGLLGKTA